MFSLSKLIKNHKNSAIQLLSLEGVDANGQEDTTAAEVDEDERVKEVKADDYFQLSPSFLTF